MNSVSRGVIMEKAAAIINVARPAPRIPALSRLRSMIWKGSVSLVGISFGTSLIITCTRIRATRMKKAPAQKAMLKPKWTYRKPPNNGPAVKPAIREVV